MKRWSGPLAEDNEAAAAVAAADDDDGGGRLLSQAHASIHDFWLPGSNFRPERIACLISAGSGKSFGFCRLKLCEAVAAVAAVAKMRSKFACSMQVTQACTRLCR